MTSPTALDLAREEITRRERQETDAILAVALGSKLVPHELTTEAVLHLAAPKDFEESRRGKLRLLEVKATVTRFVGLVDDPEDSRVYVRVDGWVQPLKADWTPDGRKERFWTPLPPELAGTLLGRTMIAEGAP